MLRTAIPRHAARTSIAGTVESIQDITAQILTDCHRAFYDPSNLILCVVGDVDAAKVLAQADRPVLVIR
ncbi:MAG: insulinase family protein [Alistipes finegoldii]|nr:insulinase family protein [Alistipes finegoldii]